MISQTKNEGIEGLPINRQSLNKGIEHLLLNNNHQKGNLKFLGFLQTLVNHLLDQYLHPINEVKARIEVKAVISPKT